MIRNENGRFTFWRTHNLNFNKPKYQKQSSREENRAKMKEKKIDSIRKILEHPNNSGDRDDEANQKTEQETPAEKQQAHPFLC